MNIDRQDLWALRFVIIFWAMGWLLKFYFFSQYFFGQIVIYPIVDPFFPGTLTDPYLAQAAYTLPIVFLAAIITRRIASFRVLSLLMLVCSAILVLHNDSYNDATFLTSFWVAAWLVWFTFSYRGKSDDFRRNACRLAQTIVGLIFWGGVVGKVTPEYFNGDAFLNIFMSDNAHWPFSVLRDYLSPEHLHSVAQVISQIVIFVELIISFGLFLPSWLFCLFAPFLMLGIMMFSTWKILSVLFCLMGLLWSCLILLVQNKDKVKGR